MSKDRIVRMIGLGLDSRDCQLRVTDGDNFAVYQGSEKSHRAMREICMQINHILAARGQALSQLSRDEFLKILAELPGATT
jgi:signal-transduction protein with cAMP-binding, CBS, and nucleotidyltransferase domain